MCRLYKNTIPDKELEHPQMLVSVCYAGRSAVFDSLQPHGLQPTRFWWFSKQEYLSGLWESWKRPPWTTRAYCISWNRHPSCFPRKKPLVQICKLTFKNRNDLPNIGNEDLIKNKMSFLLYSLYYFFHFKGPLVRHRCT